MRILAVDLGKARTGLAVCDEGFGFPSGRYTGIQPGTPCGCRCRKSRNIDVGKFFVGLPRNMDGSEGESAQSARALPPNSCAL